MPAVRLKFSPADLVTPCRADSQPPTRPCSSLSSRPLTTDEDRRDRCQSDWCKTARNELRAKCVQVVRELEELRLGWRREVAGGVRAWECEEGGRLRRDLETAEQEAAFARRDLKCWTKKARTLEDERVDLLDDKASLALQVAELKAAAAKFEISSRYEVRAAARQARAELRVDAEEQASWAEMRVEAAAAREQAAVTEGEEQAAWAEICIEAAAAREQAAVTVAVTAGEEQAAWAEMRVEAAAVVAAEEVEMARCDAADARAEALEAAADAAAAEQGKTDAEWLLLLSEKREARSKAAAAALKEKLGAVAPPTQERTPDEWAALSREANWRAHQRDQDRTNSFLGAHNYHPSDLGVVLAKRGLLAKVLGSPKGADLYFERTKQLLTRLEQEHYGIAFALYLRFELHLTMPKILEVTKAGCKRYKREEDKYVAKIAHYHPHSKGKLFLKVPRLAPPASQLIPLIRSVEEKLACVIGENGRVAQRPVATVFQELLSQDPG